MATYTPNLNLYKPDSTDNFEDFRAEFNNNMDILDNGGGGGGGGNNYVYGAFIDTDNVIKATTSFYTSMSYTATEDCYIEFYLVIATNGSSTQILIDGKEVGKFYRTSIVGDTQGFFVKKGQVVSVSDAHSSYDSSYVVYGIIQGTQGIFAPTIYSDNERVIGVWRDNKPLYQRSWTGTKSTSSDEIIINDPPSIDTLANSFVTIKGSTGSQFAQYYRDPNDRARIWLEGGKIHMDSGASYPIMPYTYTVTLQYTKTTDVAGSGNWNTDGIPTVHYSTSEQVIGTWIDGKPLYQITVDVPSPVNDSNEHLIDLTSLAIDECPFLSGYAVRHSGANDITYYANSIETDGWYYFKARYDNFRNSIMYICLFRNDSISRMKFTIQYTKTTD